MPTNSNELIEARRDKIRLLHLGGMRGIPDILKELEKTELLEGLKANYKSMLIMIRRDIKIVRAGFNDEARVSEQERNEQLAIFRFELTELKETLKEAHKWSLYLRVLKELAATYEIGTEAQSKIIFDQTIEMTFNKIEQTLIGKVDGMEPADMESFAKRLTIQNAKIKQRNRTG